jgi:hypothetical protein
MSYSDDEEYDERSDEYDDEEDYDCNGRSYARTSQSRPQTNTRDVQDYAQAYALLDDDVLGDQSSDEGEEDFFLGEGMTSKKASRGGSLLFPSVCCLSLATSFPPAYPQHILT